MTFFFFVDAVLLCFAILSVQIAVDWLREGLSKDTCSSAMSCDSACVLQVILGRSHWNCYIMDAIWMLGLARNIVFFRVNSGYGSEKSWLQRAALLGSLIGVVALPSNPARFARAL